MGVFESVENQIKYQLTL